MAGGPTKLASGLATAKPHATRQIWVSGSSVVYATQDLVGPGLLRRLRGMRCRGSALEIALEILMRRSSVLSAMLLAAALMPGVCHAATGERTSQAARTGKLIVIGFMGGNVHAGNLLHREALVAEDLQQCYPLGLRAAVFANRDGSDALRTVLQLLDVDGDGRLSAEEKSAARIVIYGHSWGASETVTLARRLGELGIPVLLTIQVDSVQKSNEDDYSIPPNVREAVNFYQTRGLVHGRSVIAAMDPAHTTILGNYESSYRGHPISCAGYPWFARTFMRSHIEIENDPSVWTRIEALIRADVL
jgi:hypothetical protein